jgi:hypothetical protein
VPALVWIFQIWSVYIIRNFHVNGVSRANIVAGAAAGAFLHVENGWHFFLQVDLFANREKFALRNRVKRTGEFFSFLLKNHKTAPFAIVRVGKIQPMVVGFIPAFRSEKGCVCHDFTDR